MSADYPHNIVIGQNYTLYVGAVNHLGSDAFYTVYVKLVNQKDSLPNTNSGVYSSLQPIYEYTFFLGNGGSWEKPLVFSISKALTNGNESIINQFLINNLAFDINKYSIRDTNSAGFYYGLVCELWVYNATTNTVQFHNRAVSLVLNLLEPT